MPVRSNRDVIFATSILIILGSGVWVMLVLMQSHAQGGETFSDKRLCAPVITVGARDHNSGAFTIQDGVDALARIENGGEGWVFLTCDGLPRCSFLFDEPVVFPKRFKRGVVGLETGTMQEFRWKKTGADTGFDWGVVEE